MAPLLPGPASTALGSQIPSVAGSGWGICSGSCPVRSHGNRASVQSARAVVCVLTCPLMQAGACRQAVANATALAATTVQTQGELSWPSPEKAEAGADRWLYVKDVRGRACGRALQCLPLLAPCVSLHSACTLHELGRAYVETGAKCVSTYMSAVDIVCLELRIQPPHYSIPCLVSAQKEDCSFLCGMSTSH